MDSGESGTQKYGIRFLWQSGRSWGQVGAMPPPKNLEMFLYANPLDKLGLLKDNVLFNKVASRKKILPPPFMTTVANCETYDDSGIIFLSRGERVIHPVNC